MLFFLRGRTNLPALLASLRLSSSLT